MEVYVYVATKVLIFESAKVGLIMLRDRQTEYSPIHINEHKRKDVVYRITNINYANYYKI